MPEFLTLLQKFLPLYTYIGLGYAAGRLMHIEGRPIASLLFYFVVPPVVFSILLNTEIRPALLLLPFIIWALASAICLLAYRLSAVGWKDSTRGIIAFASANGNAGFFGLSVALMLFTKETIGIFSMLLFGLILFENTVGFVITAHGKSSTKQVIRRLLHLPTLYAFFFGISLKMLGIHEPGWFHQIVLPLQGAYTTLGMMIIGLSLAQIANISFDWKFLGVIFAVRFIVWPLAGIIFIALDHHLLHLFPASAYPAITLFCALPIAANTAVLATLHNTQPAKAATAVLSTTIFAMVFVPLLFMK